MIFILFVLSNALADILDRVLSYEDKVSCSVTQHLVPASIEHAAFGLPLSGLIQSYFFITKKTGFDISCNRKWDLN